MALGTSEAVGRAASAIATRALTVGRAVSALITRALTGGSAVSALITRTLTWENRRLGASKLNKHYSIEQPPASSKRVRPPFGGIYAIPQKWYT